MQILKTPRARNLVGLGYLLVLTIGTAIGIVFSIQEFRFYQYLVFFLGFEFIYLLSARRTIDDQSLKNALMFFAIKMQLQTIFTVVVTISVLCPFFLALIWNDYSIWDSSTTESVSRTYIIMEFAFAFFKLSTILSLALSVWRLHSLRESKANFAEIATKGYQRKVIALGAAKDAALNRLDYYTSQINSADAPKYFKYAGEFKVSSSSSFINGEKTFELVFSTWPTKLCLSIESMGSNTSLLVVSYKNRGGYYRTNLFLNPIDAYSILHYAKTYVIQPFLSDLALTDSAKKQDELRLQAAETQLRILQAQIEPHFLFNTLANIRHLYRSNVDTGEEMMDHLIRYLRSTMEDLRSDVSTVGREIDLALHYLAIMKIRMGKRLEFTFIAPDGVSNLRFPPAMLISLVENAIKHGLNSKEDGKLTISAAIENKNIRVTVQDNGVGFSSVQGTGVGLSNIRQRLEALYGNSAWLEVGALQTGGFVATLSVPLPE